MPMLLPDPRQVLRIYTLGDSNALGDQGWPVQLRRELQLLLKNRRIELHNEASAGRAIGFQKFGPESNALLVAEGSLKRAFTKAGGPMDEAVICLGTNDAQPMWTQQGKTIDEIAQNMRALVEKIRSFRPRQAPAARVTIASPPALGSIHDDGAPPATGVLADEQAKRRGSRARIEEMIPRLREVAEQTGSRFVDVYGAMFPQRDRCVGADGTHLAAAGHALIGKVVAEAIVSK